MSKNWRIFVIAQSCVLLGVVGYLVKLYFDLATLQTTLPRIEPLLERVEEIEEVNLIQTEDIEELRPTEEEMEATANMFKDYEARIGDLQNTINQLRKALESQSGSSQTNAKRLEVIEEELAALESLRKEFAALATNQNSLNTKIENALYQSP